MKIITVVGARPQFIKAAAISRVIKKEYDSEINEVLVHTGQHFDNNMSNIFFEQLDIPKPKYNLEISGGSHGLMTGRMLESIEKVTLLEKPDYLLVYGDTNSTLAGAIVASKMHIPIAHVESGLRSYNMKMPEEINRIITDRISSLLLCPTKIAVENLNREGILEGVYNTGDVMYDAAIFYGKQVAKKSTFLENLGINDCEFVLATCHRAENTDDPIRLKEILNALVEVSLNTKVVFPIHPRTKKLIQEYGFNHLTKSLLITEPLDFIDMISLEKSAKMIFTDSGGIQKEAYFYGVPCITMRDETEWIETVTMGCNKVVGANKNKILEAYKYFLSSPPKMGNEKPYGSGKAANKIVNHILNNKG